MEIKLIGALYDVDPVVVTGQITRRTLDNSVQKLRVLSAEEIESSAVISAKDVPELEANLNLTQDPRLGIAGGINGMNQTLKKGRIKYTPF
ncbi:MAG: outer membrane cobalamin receptor [Flavobacteriales bacterium]